MADQEKPAATIAPWQVLDSKYSYRDRWLAVRSDTVRVMPNPAAQPPAISRRRKRAPASDHG